MPREKAVEGPQLNSISPKCLVSCKKDTDWKLKNNLSGGDGSGDSG